MNRFIVHIEVVVPTENSPENYLGKHLGLKLLSRPLTQQIVTFVETVTEDELQQLFIQQGDNKQICKELRLGANAIQANGFWISQVTKIED